MKNRKSVLMLCVLVISAALVAIYCNHFQHNAAPVASVSEVPAQVQTSQNTLPPPQAAAETKTPAPVAQESNKVTVDFSGVQPVINE